MSNFKLTRKKFFNLKGVKNDLSCKTENNPKSRSQSVSFDVNKHNEYLRKTKIKIDSILEQRIKPQKHEYKISILNSRSLKK